MLAIYSNQATQTLLPGQSLNMTKIAGQKSNCQINPTNGANVKGKGVFLAAFSGNISGAAAGTPVELSLEIDGTTVPSSRMISTPSAADAFNDVSTVTAFSDNCCCMGTKITVINTGTVAVTVDANASLVIWKLD